MTVAPLSVSTVAASSEAEGDHSPLPGAIRLARFDGCFRLPGPEEFSPFIDCVDFFYISECMTEDLGRITHKNMNETKRFIGVHAGYFQFDSRKIPQHDIFKGLTCLDSGWENKFFHLETAEREGFFVTMPVLLIKRRADSSYLKFNFLCLEAPCFHFSKECKDRKVP